MHAADAEQQRRDDLPWLPTSATERWYLEMLALTQAAMTGMGGLHLWPDWPHWNHLAPYVLPLLAMGTTLVFIPAAVTLTQRLPLWRRIYRALALLCFTATPGVVLGDSDTHRLWLVLSVLAVGALALVGTLVWTWLHGDTYGRWMTLGLAPGLLTALPPALLTVGVVPFGFWTLHGMQVGSAIQMPIVVLALLWRSAQHRKVLDPLLEADTANLGGAGLIDDRNFTHQVDQTLQRSLSGRYQSVVMLVEITNMDQLREYFGDKSAAEMPSRIGQRLIDAVREVDTVAQLSETRFGVVIEGPVTPKEAADMGPRIVARCIMPFEDRPQAWHGRVHVAQAIVPLDAAQASVVVNHLHVVLQNIAPNDRRTVFQMYD